MVTATSERSKPAIRAALLTAAVIAGLTAAGLWWHSSAPTPAAGSFAWFTAAVAPRSWMRVQLPDGSATLAFPAVLRRLPADRGAISVGEFVGRQRFPTLYLNATPREGHETLADWRAFRLQHLMDEARAVHFEGAARDLRFLGGTASCVADEYVTRVADNHYREIACYVAGRGGGSVLVAATVARDWVRYGGVLERAVEAYRAS
jgi:hypothetical protein